MHSFLVEALQLLVTFLADEDPNFISNVQSALRHLLNTKAGQLALAELGVLPKAEAAVFIPLHPLANPMHSAWYAQPSLTVQCKHLFALAPIAPLLA